VPIHRGRGMAYGKRLPTDRHQRDHLVKVAFLIQLPRERCLAIGLANIGIRSGMKFLSRFNRYRTNAICRVHNPKVPGSSPGPATYKKTPEQAFFRLRVCVANSCNGDGGNPLLSSQCIIVKSRSIDELTTIGSWHHPHSENQPKRGLELAFWTSGFSCRDRKRS